MGTGSVCRNGPKGDTHKPNLSPSRLNMKILGVTDIHNRIENLQRILKDAGQADLVLLGGDLTNFGTPENAENIVHLAQSSKVPVLAVAGNCDSALIAPRLLGRGG